MSEERQTWGFSDCMPECVMIEMSDGEVIPVDARDPRFAAWRREVEDRLARDRENPK